MEVKKNDENALLEDYGAGESVYDRLWALKSHIEDMIDQIASGFDIKDDISVSNDSDYKLAIVVGHSRNDPGAYGIAPISSSEYFWNTDLANIIKSQAEARKISCSIFFRDNGGIPGAYSRVERWGAHGCIELHFNSASPTTTGTEVLYGHLSKSKDFAGIVQKELVSLYKRTGRADRKIKSPKPGEREYPNVTALKSIPNCLIEPFFGDHPEDAALGQSLKNNLASALLESFLYFLKNN